MGICECGRRVEAGQVTGRDKTGEHAVSKGERGVVGRAAAGALLKQLRIAAGLSQGELAARMSEVHSTFISQLETGRAVLPSPKVIPFAQACDVDAGELAACLLAFYDPDLFLALFGVDASNVAAPQRRSASPEQADRTAVEHVLTLLRESSGPSTTDDLAARARLRHGDDVTKAGVYQVLYRLWRQGRICKAGDFWSLDRAPQRADPSAA